MRTIYTIILWLLLPLIFLRLGLRSRRQPEYLQHIGERFGFYAIKCEKPVIWLHTVSVGETRAAASLVARLKESYPDHQILLTHTTPTGRAAGEQLYGGSVLRAYLPYDYPFAVRRFLRHFKPVLGMLMETEIWFNLIHAGKEAEVPMLLLNARMSEKSAKGYERISALTGNALHELSAVAAQGNDDADRLMRLGAKKVSVMGNLKFDISPPEKMLELGAKLREQFGARPILLLASTREGEEKLLLDAWLAEDFQADALLLIVPRHPQRFDEVAEMLKKRGLGFQRRSENRPVADEVRVVLGDSMGEMFAYYAACDIAFIGGILLPFGGQNLIEACSVGKPVLIGPHTFNFADATRLAIEAGAAIRVSDADELMQEAARILQDAGRMALMERQGKRFVASHQGATGKAMDIIRHVKIATAEPQST